MSSTRCLLVALWLPLAVAADAQTPPVSPEPAMAAARNPMSRADPDMLRAIAAWKALGPKPVETLEPSEARRQPGLSDALAKVVEEDRLAVDPHAGLSVTTSNFADLGNLRLRFYEPERKSPDAKLPMILYFRGGGWVLGDIDDYDAAPAALARKSGAVVISADYPLAPEDRFPAAHDEAVDAYKYVLRSAKEWNYDENRIALVGEDAGGNLVLNTAIAARDQKLVTPAAVVAVHPIATTAMDTPSKRAEATAKPLGTAALTWLFGYVVRSEADRQDPRLNLVAADLKGLPPVTVIGAEIDPLRSEGEMLAMRLRDANVETTHEVYAGVTHGFFGLGAVVAKAREAQSLAVAQIRRGFEAPR